MAPVVFVQREKERKKERRTERERASEQKNNVDEVIIWKNKTRTRLPLKCFLSKLYL